MPSSTLTNSSSMRGPISLSTIFDVLSACATRLKSCVKCTRGSVVRASLSLASPARLSKNSLTSCMSPMSGAFLDCKSFFNFLFAPTGAALML